MKPENLHLNRYHLNMGKNIYQHWMLSHLSEKNFSYRWLLIFFFFFFVCAKKRNCKYIKILLGTRKRWGMVDWLTKPLILSSDFLQKGCWSLQEAVQGQDLDRPLLPGPGTHHPWTMGSNSHCNAHLIGDVTRSPFPAGGSNFLQFCLTPLWFQDTI